MQLIRNWQIKHTVYTFIFLRSGILAKHALWLAASWSGFLRSGPLSRIPDRSRHHHDNKTVFDSFWHSSVHLNGILEAFLHTSCATIKAFLVYTSVLHTFSTRKRQQKNKDVLFLGLGRSISRKTLPEVLKVRTEPLRTELTSMPYICLLFLSIWNVSVVRPVPCPLVGNLAVSLIFWYFSWGGSLLLLLLMVLKVNFMLISSRHFFFAWSVFSNNNVSTVRLRYLQTDT